MWSLSLERRSREVHEGHAQAPSPPRTGDLQTLHILKGTVSNPQWLRRGFKVQSSLLSLPQRQNVPRKVSIDVTLLNFSPSLAESLCFYVCELMILALSVFLEKAPAASIGKCPCPSSFFTSSESLPLLPHQDVLYAQPPVPRISSVLGLLTALGELLKEPQPRYFHLQNANALERFYLWSCGFGGKLFPSTIEPNIYMAKNAWLKIFFS